MLSRIMIRAGMLIVLAIALVGVQACSDDDNPAAPTGNQAPVLPDISTMTIDLSFFDQAQVPPQMVSKGNVDEMSLVETGKDNFINAAVRTLYLQLTFWAALQPPVAAFAVAIHSVPQPQDDGSYLWTYIFVEEEIEYAIYLYGIDAGTSTQWRMEVSTNNPEMPLDHFVWFAGEAMKNNSSGHWQFYEPVIVEAFLASAAVQTPGEQSIRIDWENLPGDVHTLAILNNYPGSPDEGDNIVFFESPAMSFVEFTDESTPEVYNITWYFDGSGSLEVPDYNGGEKACWDIQQNDIVCP
jgi:hypothetical protein